MTKFKDRTKINVSKHIEKKGKFNYLSWVYALSQLQEQDETATWSFLNHTEYPDGSMCVNTIVTAFGKTIPMTLPVMDNKNKAIQNPNAFDINTAYMRCLAKNIAAHGIGLYIYAGEDLPEVDEETIDEAQVYDLKTLLEETGSDEKKFLTYFKVAKISDLPESKFSQAIELLEKKKAA